MKLLDIKYLIVGTAVLMLGCKAHSQQVKCDTIHLIADEMPIYKSGHRELIEDIRKYVAFTEECPPEKLRQITWVIDKGGNITNVEVLTVNEECAKYIASGVKKLDRWAPGKIKGKAVCVKLILPIHIRPKD